MINCDPTCCCAWRSLRDPGCLTAALIESYSPIAAKRNEGALTKQFGIQSPRCPICTLWQQRRPKASDSTGEQPDSVFQVGGLGIDNIKRLPLLSREALEEALDFSWRRAKPTDYVPTPVTLEHKQLR